MIRLRTFTAILLVTVALTSCNLAPEFLLPTTPKPGAFKEAALPPSEIGSWKVGKPSAALPRGEWWRVFNDPYLDVIEEAALKDNQKISAMVARVKQARATASVASSYLFPDISNVSGFTRRQPNAVSRGLTPGSSLAIENDATTTFSLGYELDLFGRISNQSAATIRDAESADETLQSMRLALQAEVADTYFGLQALDFEIDLLTRGVTLRQKSVDILRKRVSAGSITELDLASSVVDLETTRNQLREAVRQRQEREHALAVLLGRTPEDFSMSPAEFLAKIPIIPPGIPSTLLERRPDVAAAQHDLAAANARIGAARAAFFPSISLTGTGGFESDTLPSLFTWSSRSWSIGPSLTLPIFSGSRATANLSRSRARYEEVVANYRQRVLESFRDVEDSLTQLKSLSQQASSQYIAENAAKRAAKIASLRYDSGDLGYLETLSARRTALETERAGVQIKYARLSATIRLIRALGGGWESEKTGKR